ncbi:hypothetical protein MKEN_01181900 [Mycena kentingensis (nom. inval.)]|nr:hypothetical protein MKEN_01181900 [Mycena kentingensis (nom. inval.)]
MGNSSSSGRGPHDETVDYGNLVPQGVYTGQRDWNQSITAQLIIARRLAPFYRPLEDYDDSWDDDRILAARKALPEPESDQQLPPSQPPKKRSGAAGKEPSRPEAAVYRNAVECPICFLYYPPNINHSRCCDQAICTECFVQIKRNEPTTTHIVSEPAACPYCVQDNFGIVYTAPPWRAGIGADSGSPWSDSGKGSAIETPTHKRRQKSFGADSPDVVLTDHIRPDWEQKLAAVRAAVQRRANRRIIMRQVGDRLIPIGVTSGRVHALTPEEAAQAAESTGEGSGSRRSRRRQQPPSNGNLEQFMGMGGAELEELMLMEAMRLSLIEHEEQQRKEAEEKKKAEAAAANATPTVASSSSLSVNKPASSRSRSPSPNPLQALKDTASGWRRRTSSPPPVTLSAALSAVSTASAVLNGVGPSQVDSTPSPPTPTIIEPDASSTAAEAVAPTAPAGHSVVVTTPSLEAPAVAPTEPAVPVAEPVAATLETAHDPEPLQVHVPSRPVPTHLDTMMSAISTTSSVGAVDSYNNLPSSPDDDDESIVAREPLLESPTEITEPADNTPKHPSTQPDDQNDYFGDAPPTTTTATRD